MKVMKKNALGSLRQTMRLEADENVEQATKFREAYVAQQRSSISGVRKKNRLPSSPVEFEPYVIVPKQFLIVVHYHYPLVVFPRGLKEELNELEEFFSIRLNQRGEGTLIQGGRLLATMTYRTNMKPVNVLGFRKTLCELLDRYGVEIINYKITRI